MEGVWDHGAADAHASVSARWSTHSARVCNFRPPYLCNLRPPPTTVRRERRLGEGDERLEDPIFESGLGVYRAVARPGG